MVLIFKCWYLNRVKVERTKKKDIRYFVKNKTDKNMKARIVERIVEFFT